jgi:NYN domain
VQFTPLVTRYEEKQTDVAIASTILADAIRGNMSRIILVTADSDQIPLVKTIKECFPDIVITLAAPPGRGGEARELGGLVHERRPIDVGHLRSCLLPKDIYNSLGKKVATRPALYESKS